MPHVMQRVVAVLGLILVAPVILLGALVVFLEDRHSPFFAQERVGLHGERFSVYKIRTMIPRADDFLGTDVQRVLRSGRFLRRWGIDELTQLVNVARGEMNLVGPRPILQDRYEALRDEFGERWTVRPGITGLAQILGRNSVLWTDRIRADLEYVRERSIGLDLKILVSTPAVLLDGSAFRADRNPEEVDDITPGARKDGDSA